MYPQREVLLGKTKSLRRITLIVVPDVHSI
jgi:hypothetical protein